MIELLICLTLALSDGDSGRCHTPDGQRHRVRLHGIDAAEVAPFTRCRRQPDIWACRPENRAWGPVATERARELAAKGAECRVIERDRYQRIVVRCDVGGRDLGSVLVREGLAVADARYGADYRDDEALARRERRGVWR